MKSDLHPTYNKETKVTCACGNTFTVGSTEEKIETEICSECHPFYTGEGKLIDTAGRIEKFKERMERHETLKKEKEKTEKKQKDKDEEEGPASPSASDRSSRDGSQGGQDTPEQLDDKNIRITK